MDTKGNCDHNSPPPLALLPPEYINKRAEAVPQLAG